MKQYKMGIVGLGDMSRYHIWALEDKGYERVIIKGVYDINGEKYEFANKKGYHIYSSYEDMLSDDEIDIVLIATSNEVHKELSIKALEAGKNVLCEKPVTPTSAELIEIMSVAEKSGKVFTIDQNRRVNKDFVLMKRCVESGMIGKPYIIESKQNLLITNVDDFIDDKENWSGPITIENGEIYLNGALKKGNYAGYSGRKIGQYEILRMKTNSNLSNYQGWGMNADHPDDELWKSSGYTIIGKRNIFEIQRRYWKDDGGIAAEILGTVVNEESIMTSGKWYTIEIGCVKTPFGTRIIMNIEGKPVVDFLDSTGLALEPDGYFAFYEGSSEYNSIAKVNN